MSESPSLPAPPAPWVLVTGAAHRLGREICLAFARTGWRVLCHYRQSQALALQTQAAVRAVGGVCELVAIDLAQPKAAEQLLAVCTEVAGTAPRCIVNNASIFEADDAASARSTTLAEHLQTNTVTPLLLANTLASWVAEHDAQAPAGHYSVVHVLDQKVHNLNPDYFSYTVSKLALAASVALQAQALAPRVRVCGLSPGLMFLSGPQTPDNFQRASRVNLLREPLNPADVAACALFIAGNASVNGCTLQADNGQHLVGLTRDVMFAVDHPFPPSAARP